MVLIFRRLLLVLTLVALFRHAAVAEEPVAIDLFDLSRAVQKMGPFSLSFFDPAGTMIIRLAPSQQRNFHEIFCGIMQSGACDVDFKGSIIGLNDRLQGSIIHAFGESGFCFFVLRSVPSKTATTTNVTLGYEFRVAEGLHAAEVVDRTGARLAPITLLPSKMGRPLSGVVPGGIADKAEQIGGVKLTFTSHFSAVDWVEVPFAKLQADIATAERYVQSLGAVGDLQITAAKRDASASVLTLVFTPAAGQAGKEHALFLATVRSKRGEVVGSSGEYRKVSAAPTGSLTISAENAAKAETVLVGIGRNRVHDSSLIIPVHVRE